MNTGSDNSGSDPMSDALCRSGLPPEWWTEPGRRRNGRADMAAALCVASCECLDQCRRMTRYHEPFSRPYAVVQGGYVWPDLVTARADVVPDWWPDEPPQVPPW